MKNLTCENTKNVLEEVYVGYKTKIQSTDRVTVTNSRECYNHLFLAYDKDTFQYKESFFAMYLNRANKVLGVLKISEGGVCGTVCDARIIMQAALRLNASFIVLSHNHPSGNMKPSQSDIEITNRLQEAAKFMDMKILDHIIVSADENTYYSFGDEGRL